VAVVVAMSGWRRARTARRRVPARDVPTAVAVATGNESRPVRAARGHTLDVADVSVRFGGVVALDRVGLSAGAGNVTGLIGPNGAGKTTLFNVVSGLLRPDHGSVQLDGRDLSRLGPAARARAGIGRTFQQPELFESLAVRDAVALGYEASLAGRSIRAQVFPRPGDQAATRLAVDRALDAIELSDLHDVRISELSSAERRLVELARALAGPFGVLLLDEPTAGLDRAERDRFAALVREVARSQGRAVLLVEHDMAVVMDVCDAIYVLDFGRLVFRGPPQAVRDSPEVRAAYLGERTPATGRAPR
jgi:ABC-type branched-subunit amino acid transport system ATPase component